LSVVLRGCPEIKRKRKVLSERDLMKIEIAKEIGVWEEVQRDGWGSLSNAVCGKIGGLVSSRLRNKDT